jgi:Zn finger protein HypA/HybF involved in hydrogenase expression
MSIFKFDELKKKPNSFPCDFELENGNYLRVCVDCGEEFIGYKRRLVCAVCMDKKSFLYEDKIKESPRSYHDDFKFKHGNCIKNCEECHEDFVGLKRRGLCSLCEAMYVKMVKEFRRQTGI